MIGTKQFAAEQGRQAAAKKIRVGALVKVIRFNPAAMTVDVAPLSKWKPRGGEYQSQPPLLGVPVACMCGGGFLVRPWYESGDVGAVLYLDHDIDAALSGGTECQPNTGRTHAPEDAVFIGGILTGATQLGTIPDGLALARQDGGVSVVLTKSGITINGQVEISGGLTLNGAHVKTEGQ